MKSKVLIALGIVSLFVISMSIFAHHGTQISYDMNKAVDVKGVVTKFAWLNPHSQLYFDVKDKNGSVVHWGVETNSPAILTRAGWTSRSVKPGDEVTIILCPAKNGSPVAYAGSGDPGSSDGRAGKDV